MALGHRPDPIALTSERAIPFDCDVLEGRRMFLEVNEEADVEAGSAKTRKNHVERPNCPRLDLAFYRAP